MKALITVYVICTYNPGIWQRYMLKRYSDIDGEACVDLFDDCTTYWWTDECASDFDTSCE